MTHFDSGNGALSIRPKIPKFSKRGQIVREIPGKSFRKSGNHVLDFQKRKILTILFNIVDSQEDLESIISKVRNYFSVAISFVWPNLSYSFLPYLSTSHDILRCQPQLIT